ncbi:MAG: glucose-1-phosphate adenylyltransferase [Acidobacteriota bacterium]
MKDCLAVLLAGGAGERLFPLTKNRAKPAVYFGGVYRIVDFTLSNCINSDLRMVFILTQYKSLSLERHLRLGWSLMAAELGEFIDVLSPQKRVSENWYLGTADAVYQNLYSIRGVNPKYVFVLSGDHIYKMDYSLMLQYHRRTRADVTIAAIEYPLSVASRFGILRVDSSFQVVDFMEKPADPPPMSPGSNLALVNMGVYLFNRDVLLNTLSQDAGNAESTHDFGHDVFPGMVGRYKIVAYNFKDENKKQAKYWRDIGTIDAYYEANMDLVSVDPVFNLYDPAWPLHTYQWQYPPAKFVFADEGIRMGAALDSIVSMGCIISGGKVVNSVLCPNVRVNSYSLVETSILMRNVRIGRYAKIRNAIIDTGVQIPEGTRIGYDLDADRERYMVTPGGITVVASPELPVE